MDVNQQPLAQKADSQGLADTMIGFGDLGEWVDHAQRSSKDDSTKLSIRKSRNLHGLHFLLPYKISKSRLEHYTQRYFQHYFCEATLASTIETISSISQTYLASKSRRRGNYTCNVQVYNYRLPEVRAHEVPSHVLLCLHSQSRRPGAAYHQAGTLFYPP